VTATFTTVSDFDDLAHSQQRERDSGSRHIVLWEMRRSEWEGNGSKGGSGRGVSGFILPRGSGLGWSFIRRDWASWAVVWGGTVDWFQSSCRRCRWWLGSVGMGADLVRVRSESGVSG
jgi:hypothetical protein